MTDAVDPAEQPEPSYPHKPDYAVVSKSDLAAVLTVYESHVPPEVRVYCGWYLRCKEAVS